MAILFSLTPIIVLLALMLLLRMRGDISALLSLGTAILIALFAEPQLEGISSTLAESMGAEYILWAVIEGMLKATFPILLIIVMAIYSYNVLLASGQIEVIKSQLMGISQDRRIQVLLIVWGFGGLLEGMAGFGTAVAIPAAILISLGFSPRFAALVSLIGNSVATGFAAVGVPVITLAKEAYGSDVSPWLIQVIAGDVIIQLSPVMFLVPLVILYLTDRSRAYWLSNILLTVAVGGISLLVQFVCAYYLGAETPAILGSLACILFLILYARLTERQERPKQSYTLAQSAKAWAVYSLILGLILLSSPLSGGFAQWLKSLAVSHIALPIYAEGKTFDIYWISNASTMLLLGAVLGGLIQGLTLGQLARILVNTFATLGKSAVTILSLVAMSAVMSHSGMIACIATALVQATGTLYPFFAPVVGALGTFATGSDTSSNILFGKLQAQVADQLGVDKSWLVAANTAGATGGKIISPQSIAIATVSCGQQGQEGNMLLSALPYSLVYVLCMGISVYCLIALAL